LLEWLEDTSRRVSVTREKTLGYSPLKALKIVNGLFLLCSGHCLEITSMAVFFSSDQTKASTLLVVSLQQESKFVLIQI